MSRGDPGPGGWAWIVPDGQSASGGAVQTDRHRMGLMAIHQALKAVVGPLEVYCDSAYVVNCFREQWWEGWIRRGWRNSDKKSIANRDLWAQIIEQTQARPIAFHRVTPDGYPAYNEATRLAAEAADQQGTVEEQSLF